MKFMMRRLWAPRVVLEGPAAAVTCSTRSYLALYYIHINIRGESGYTKHTSWNTAESSRFAATGSYPNSVTKLSRWNLSRIYARGNVRHDEQRQEGKASDPPGRHVCPVPDPAGAVYPRVMPPVPVQYLPW